MTKTETHKETKTSSVNSTASCHKQKTPLPISGQISDLTSRAIPVLYYPNPERHSPSPPHVPRLDFHACPPCRLSQSESYPTQKYGTRLPQQPSLSRLVPACRHPRHRSADSPIRALIGFGPFLSESAQYVSVPSITNASYSHIGTLFIA